MKLLLLYLKQNRKYFLLFVVFCAVFAVSFALYELPVKAIAYPAFQCAVLFAAFIHIDFVRTKRKHERLERAGRELSALPQNLPESGSIFEQDYKAVVAMLCEEKNLSQTLMTGRYNDMVDYYTVWAHQIKTPIASMRLNLQGEDTELSRKLGTDLMRIEQYVEMVLMFLRLGSSTTDYVIKEYELDSIIKQTVRKFAGEFIGRRLSLSYEPVTAHVLTDEKWLSFVIEQLLSNALKYTKKGGIKIYMPNSNTLCIEDTGIGISPEDLPRVFENGYTGYNGRRDKKASGIGLYLCRRICKNLGHSIKIESQPDVGTSVFLDLSRDRTVFE